MVTAEVNEWQANPRNDKALHGIDIRSFQPPNRYGRRSRLERLFLPQSTLRRVLAVLTTAAFEHSATNSFSPGRNASGGTRFRASARRIFILWVRAKASVFWRVRLEYMISLWRVRTSDIWRGRVPLARGGVSLDGLRSVACRPGLRPVAFLRAQELSIRSQPALPETGLGPVQGG
jgi:hypothetical protein